MTKASFRSPKVWLDMAVCESTYETFRHAQASLELVGEPLPPFSTRYSGVLESIIESVRLKSSLLEYDCVQAAASYYVQFAKSQAFMNGNKRMSVVLTDTFLDSNGYRLGENWIDYADLTLMISEDHAQKIDAIVELLEPILRDVVVEKDSGIPFFGKLPFIRS